MSAFTITALWLIGGAVGTVAVVVIASALQLRKTRRIGALSREWFGPDTEQSITEALKVVDEDREMFADLRAARGPYDVIAVPRQRGIA